MSEGVQDLVSTMIRFGTDGWRSRLDGDFTEENLIRVADAAGAFWSRRNPGAIVYVGWDAREGAERFACLAGMVLASHGLVPKVSDRFVPTPALAWSAAGDARACGAFQVTGSHHAPDYLGVKLRMEGGGTPSDDDVSEIEFLMEPDATTERGPIQRCDLATPYFDYLCSVIDADRVAAAGLRVVFDPLYGAARGYVTDALGALGVNVTEIHGTPDEDAADTHPDAVEPWVDGCEEAVVSAGAAAGLITDGDADRAGAVDERGRFVSPQRLAALVLRHLVENRGLTGRVAVNQSMSVVVLRAAEELGCRVMVRPTGFKHLYEEMRRGDVVMAAEEAGGLAVPSICPERDGVLEILLICELMAYTGRTLGELVDELERDLGPTSYGRRDLRLEVEVIEMFRTLLPGLNPAEMAGEEPVRVSHMDGLKLEFGDGSWLLLRPSGTEPVVRVYAEAPTVERRDELLEAGSDLARGDAPR